MTSLGSTRGPVNCTGSTRLRVGLTTFRELRKKPRRSGAKSINAFSVNTAFCGIYYYVGPR
jgi:hypothetical protein